MKLVSVLSRSSQASTAQRRHQERRQRGDLAVAHGIAAGHLRRRSPPTISEIADVGPTASCRDEPSSA